MRVSTLHRDTRLIIRRRPTGGPSDVVIRWAKQRLDDATTVGVEAVYDDFSIESHRDEPAQFEAVAHSLLPTYQLRLKPRAEAGLVNTVILRSDFTHHPENGAANFTVEVRGDSFEVTIERAAEGRPPNRKIA